MTSKIRDIEDRISKRALAGLPTTVDVDSRSFEIIITTETPYERYIPDPRPGASKYEADWIKVSEVLPMAAMDFSRVARMPLVDNHAVGKGKGVKAGLLGENGLLDRLKPEVQVFEDILNFTDRSKFTRTSTELARQHHLKRGSVRKEIEATAEFLNSCCRDWSKIYKVEDDHGARLIEWLEGDQRRDPLPDNVKFWAKMLVAKHQMLEDDPEDFRLPTLSTRQCYSVACPAISVTSGEVSRLRSTA